MLTVRGGQKVDAVKIEWEIVVMGDVQKATLQVFGRVDAARNPTTDGIDLERLSSQALDLVLNYWPQQVAPPTMATKTLAR